MVLRTILAVLDHNLNLGREEIDYKIVYSNARKEYVQKSVYAAKDYNWTFEIVKDIIRFATTHPDSVEFDPDVEELLFPFHLPKNITGLVKPDKATFLPIRRQRQFAK